MNRALMLALALSSASCRADEELPGRCQGASSPVESIAPAVPNATERQVRGSAVVSVVVEENERVTNPVITRSQLGGLDWGGGRQCCL